MSREPQPEKGTILLICFEAMFERMSLFSCPDRKISSEEKGISSEEKGISSEEIAINVQLYPISSEDIALIVQERGISSEKTRINVHSCTDWIFYAKISSKAPQKSSEMAEMSYFLT